jgi:membrane protease YdiL (CAAX protease family)
LGGSLILGVIWTLWHLPFWYMEGAGMAGTPPWQYLLYTVALTLNMTWLHLRTQGSVLAAILMHTTANFVSNLLPVGGAAVLDSRAYLFRALVYAVVGVVLLVLEQRQRLPNDIRDTHAGDHDH